MERTDRNVEGQTALSRLRSGSLTRIPQVGFPGYTYGFG